MGFTRNVAIGICFSVAAFGYAAPVLAEEFPFGMEMTLDARPMPGSKRIPSLDIGAAGRSDLRLWCKNGTAQVSVAGDTVIILPGAMQDTGCTPERAAADDQLLQVLSEVTNWSRKGDDITLKGPKSLKFYLNTN